MSKISTVELVYIVWLYTVQLVFRANDELGFQILVFLDAVEVIFLPFLVIKPLSTSETQPMGCKFH